MRSLSQLVLNIFVTKKETLVSHPSLKQALIYFLSWDLPVLDIFVTCDLLWVLSLSLIFSRFIHGVACVSTLFPLSPLSGESTFFYTSSSADGHVDWFHFLSLVNNSAVNICGQALERLLLSHEWHRERPPEEWNSIWGQWWGLVAQSFCVIKFY